jgi:hypothetical protein
MRLAKLFGLACAAFAALAALAVPATATAELDPEEASLQPDKERERKLLAVLADALHAAALRIGKSPQWSPITYLAEDATTTAGTTHQFAPRATTGAAITGLTDTNCLQINEIENKLPNPQYDRKTWSINRILAC